MSFVPAVTTTMVNVVIVVVATTTQIDDLTWGRDETIWNEERTLMHLNITNRSQRSTCSTQNLCYSTTNNMHSAQSNGIEQDAIIEWTNNYLCRFVVLQEKCCSSFKAVNPLRSSHLVSIFFSLSLSSVSEFFPSMEMASDRIYRFVSFLLLLPTWN